MGVFLGGVLTFIIVIVMCCVGHDTGSAIQAASYGSRLANGV